MPEHPEYDEFAETYQHWRETASPYGVVETYSFLKVLGPVRGRRVLDLATGDGRVARMLMAGGAASVLGGDISPEMIDRAVAQNTSDRGSDRTWPDLRYIVLDARDATFRLDPPADLVTAMYLFHYAPDEADLQRMADLIGRNLEPGGRFITYTLSPDYDFRRQDRRLMERCGFDYAAVGGAHCELIIGDKRVDIWQWSRTAHETCLGNAGLTDIRWHPLQAPPDEPGIAAAMDFYIANPSCLVLSARKPD